MTYDLCGAHVWVLLSSFLIFVWFSFNDFMKHYHYPTLLAAGWGKRVIENTWLSIAIAITTKQTKGQ
jgi:hypothetical protein